MHLQIKTFFELFCILGIFAFHATAYTLKTHEIYDLEYPSLTSFQQEAASWIAFGNTQSYSTCEGVPFLGGLGIIGLNTKFSRTYTSVPSHSSATVVVNFWFIDYNQWTNSDSMTIEVTGSAVTSKAFNLMPDFSKWTDTVCGVAGSKASVGFILDTPSLAPAFRLDIYNANTGASSPAQYALRDVKITFFTNVIPPVGSYIVFEDLNLAPATTSTPPGDTLEFGSYLDTGGNNISCSSPCEICSDQGCLTCNNNYLFDGVNCVSCDAQCQSCSGPLSNQCTSCYSGFFLYSDSTCQDNCENPSTSRVENNINYCDFPCQTGYYYYTDKKMCLTTCPSPYEVGQTTPYLTCQPSSTFTTLTTIQDTTQQVLSVGFLVTSAVTMGNSGGVTVTILAKMLQYIKFLGIDYPQKLQLVLETWNSTFITLEFMPSMSQQTQNLFVDRPLPDVFSKWSINSSFLVNFWQEGLSIATAVGILIFFVFLHRISIRMKNKYFPAWFFKRLKIITQNFVLLLMYSNFDDITFYAMLELRSIDSSTFASTYPILSFVTAVCFLLFAFAVLGLHLRLLILKERDKKKELIFKENTSKKAPFKGQYEGAEILFHDFNHQSFGQTAYLFFFTLRYMALYFVLTTLYRHPLAETIIIMVLNLTMLVYLFWKKPFKHILDFLEQVFCELSILSINISALTMAFLDTLNEPGVSVKDRMSTMIMVTSFIFNFTIILFWGAKIAREITAFVKTRKKKRKAQLQTQSLPANLRFKLFQVESDPHAQDDKSQGSQLKSQSLDDSSLPNSLQNSLRVSPTRVSPVVDKSKFYSASALANVPGKLPLHVIHKIKDLFQSGTKDSAEINKTLKENSSPEPSKFDSISPFNRSPRSPRRTLKLLMTDQQRGSFDFDEIISQVSPLDKSAKVINFEEGSSTTKVQTSAESFLFSKDLLSSKLKRRRTAILNKGSPTLSVRGSIDSVKLGTLLQNRDSIELDSQPSPLKHELDANLLKERIPSIKDNSTRASNVDVNSKVDTQHAAVESPSLAQAQQELASWARKRRTNSRVSTIARGSPLGILSMSKINSNSDKETIEIDSLQSSPKLNLHLQKNMSNSFTPILSKKESEANL